MGPRWGGPAQRGPRRRHDTHRRVGAGWLDGCVAVRGGAGVPVGQCLRMSRRACELAVGQPRLRAAYCVCVSVCV